MPDRAWRALLFDLKCNARGNFESEQKYRFFNQVAAVCSGFGVGTVGTLLCGQMLTQRIEPNSVLAAVLSSFLSNTNVAKLLAVFLLGTIGVSATLKSENFAKKAENFHRIGAGYNILARRAQDAVEEASLRSTDEYRAIQSLRDEQERKASQSVCDRVQEVARGIVLAKLMKNDKVVKPSLHLKYFGSLEALKSSNKKHKQEYEGLPL